jgi:hypothetical protein
LILPFCFSRHVFAYARFDYFIFAAEPPLSSSRRRSIRRLAFAIDYAAADASLTPLLTPPATLIAAAACRWRAASLPPPLCRNATQSFRRFAVYFCLRCPLCYAAAFAFARPRYGRRCCFSMPADRTIILITPRHSMLRDFAVSPLFDATPQMPRCCRRHIDYASHAIDITPSASPMIISAST